MNWRHALQTQVGIDQFTELLAQAWRDHPEIAEVSIPEPLRLRITRKAGDSPYYVALQFLWQDFQLDRRTPPVWQVQRHIQDTLASWNDVRIARPVHDSFILPTVGTADWCRRREAEGFHVVSEPLVGDLRLVYMLDDGEFEALLTTSGLSVMGLSREVLRPLSLANLERRYGPSPRCYDHGQNVHALVMGKSRYGGALLADEGVCQSVQQGLGTDRLMAAVPCCSTILFADANDRNSVQTFLRQVAILYDQDPEAVSDLVFIREHGMWRPATGPL